MQKYNFIKKDIIDNLSHQKNPPFKLVEICHDINTNYLKNRYQVVIVFIRAVLDYIPPIFGYKTTSQVYSNLKKYKSFKKALEGVDKSTRNLADDILHNQATINEIIKVDKPSCDFVRDNLTLILTSVINQLEKKDLRTTSLNRLEKKYEKPKSQIQLFEKYIKNIRNWKKEFINSKEVWIYSKDNLYQIHQQDDIKDFSEPWTQVWFNSKGSGKYYIDLKYNGSIIKQFPMIYFDGGRENIIMPKMETSSKTNFWENKDIYGGHYKNVAYYIIKDSIEYNLSKLLGSNIEKIIKKSNIEIR